MIPKYGPPRSPTKDSNFPHDFLIAVISALISAITTIVVGGGVYVWQLRDGQIGSSINTVETDVRELRDSVTKLSKEIRLTQDNLEHIRSINESDRKKITCVFGNYNVYLKHFSDHLLFVYDAAKDPAERWQTRLSQAAPAVERDGAAVQLLSCN
jgi:hypothetical protein